MYFISNIYIYISGWRVGTTGWESGGIILVELAKCILMPGMFAGIARVVADGLYSICMMGSVDRNRSFLSADCSSHNEDIYFHMFLVGY